LLKAAKDNAILIPTWYSGTNKIISNVYIGPDHALDLDKYFIIAQLDRNLKELLDTR